MPNLITQKDGSVRWDYDVPEKPAKKAAPKPTSTTTEKES